MAAITISVNRFVKEAPPHFYLSGDIVHDIPFHHAIINHKTGET